MQRPQPVQRAASTWATWVVMLALPMTGSSGVDQPVKAETSNIPAACDDGRKANTYDLYDSISVNADVPGSEGDSIAARPASTK